MEATRRGTERPRAAEMLAPAFRRFLWSAYDNLWTLVLANLLWILLAIPLITAPAATGGLYHLTRRMAWGEPAHVRDFFVGFRAHLKPSTAIGAATMAVFVLLWVAVDFYSHLRGPMEIPGLVISAVLLWGGLFLLLMHVHAFPLVVDGERSFVQILRKSALLVLDNPAFTLGVIVQATAVKVICIITGAGFFLAAVSFTALLLSIAHRELLRKYRPGEVPPDEPERRTWRSIFRPWEHPKTPQK